MSKSTLTRAPPMGSGGMPPPENFLDSRFSEIGAGNVY